MNEEKLIRRDRLRYTKNTLSSTLAIFAILFDVFFFVSIYETDVGSYYYRIIIGASVLYNLLFMLFAFLASEGVKQYKLSYAVLLLVLGVGQFVRIFIIPLDAHGTPFTTGVGESQIVTTVMEDPQFIRVVVYLAVSGALCLAGGIVGIVKTRMLARHNARIGAAAV